MSKQKQLKKLPQELINQIAAGEVIERPASVVKELLDNAIDAGASLIKIRIEEGGIKLIEISDNGSGIESENLSTVFEPHTTSKINVLEDLDSIGTMGFRGEALSTILSVAKVSISSKIETSESANILEFENDRPRKVKKVARNQGTTISVKDLFYNVPARKKFLKTPETEYRKVLQTVVPYLLQFPNIHFTLEKNGREVYNLPSTSSQPGINQERIAAVLRGKFTKDLIKVKAEGAGMKLSGFIAHPSHHQGKTSHQYIFINKRPIWDNGVAKSVQMGYGTYIPKGERVPFIINIELNPNLVDVNVHPRKEEVKFINPYRVFSLVESAVNKALEGTTELSQPSQFQPAVKEYGQSEPAHNNQLFDTQANEKASGPKEFNYSKRNSKVDVSESIKFSKEILSEEKMEGGNINGVFQIFNKYIGIEFDDELWLLDQHAAAERITFEKLLKSYDSKEMDVQNLLVPSEIEGSKAEISFIAENLDFFKNLGFSIETDEDSISVKSIPSYFQQSSIDEIFKELWQLTDEQRDIKESFDTAKESILATMSCHTSIRTGQSLTREECLQIYRDLKDCRNPYSCPHGRPIVWKMPLRQIDSNFERTY